MQDPASASSPSYPGFTPSSRLPSGRGVGDDPLRWSLCEIAASLQARELGAVELMQRTLQRIEERNGILNALVTQRQVSDLLADAEQADRDLAQGGAPALAGVPFAVKDLEPVAGLRCTRGSQIFRDEIAERDSTQVSRLRAAGAIVVGKANTPEFGFTAITKNPLFGTTRSPWDEDRTPGGSSGGSAALLAGSVVPLVTASDGGGSIRIPASFTGTFGLKPSYGRVPRGPLGAWDYQDTSVYGPLTKTVADAGLILDQIAGPSPCDPNSLPASGVSYFEAAQRPLERPLRIAYSADLGYAVVQTDIARCVADAAQRFATLGHTVEELPEGPPFLGELWGKLGNFELAGQIHEALHQRRSEITRSLARALDDAWKMTPELWGAQARARAALNDWCASLFSNFDLLLTPTVPIDPPPAGGPFPTTVEGRQLPAAAVAAFTIPFNFSWHPAATVRAGMSRVGLPVGLQIVGPRHQDDLVLRAAATFEAVAPWHPEWP